MSPWRRNTLEVAFAADQVDLVYAARGAWPGRANVVSKQQLSPDVGEAGAKTWRGAIQVLASALGNSGKPPAAARVILSSRLVRYALIPWCDTLSDADEEAAFARHCFARVYGDAAAQWELRVSPNREGAAALAVAVDADLLGALRDTFARAGIPLASVQPNLMSLYNEFRRRLRKRTAWLALLERGSLCLALLQQGEWIRMRSMRIGPLWQHELPLILQREAYLVDPAVATPDVFLWTSGVDDSVRPEDEHWRFHMLAAGARARPAPSDDGRAVSVAGA